MPTADMELSAETLECRRKWIRDCAAGSGVSVLRPAQLHGTTSSNLYRGLQQSVRWLVC